MNPTKHFKKTRRHWVWILLVCVIVAGCGQETDLSDSASANSSLVKPISGSDQLSEVLASAGKGLVVIEFYADWCGPCRELKPIYERLVRKYRGRFVATKVNVDYSKDLARKYRVVGIPNMVFVKNGKVVDVLKGLQSSSAYENAILKHMDPN